MFDLSKLPHCHFTELLVPTEENRHTSPITIRQFSVDLTSLLIDSKGFLLSEKDFQIKKNTNLFISAN